MSLRWRGQILQVRPNKSRVQTRDTEVNVAGGEDRRIAGALEGAGDGRSGRGTEAVTRWTDVAAPVEVAVDRVAVAV